MSPEFQRNIIDNDTARHGSWDVLIIGAGMGGGTAAYALTKCGFKVLLIEKGDFADPDEEIDFESLSSESPDRRIEQGRWPEKINGLVDGKEISMWPPLGCGLGGSSLLYAATLHRLARNDFTRNTINDNGAHSINWPYDYDEIEPYYQEAEELFTVAGTEDPLETKSNYRLRTPPEMCERDQHFYTSLRKSKLNPYRMHVGINYRPNCSECGGYYCFPQCKSDARNRCIIPALKTGKLSILVETEVISINAGADTVDNVLVRKNGHQFNIKATAYILSSGAYFSPVILQNSSNKYWPNGLGNHNDLVGRYLMFHASDFIAIWPNGKYTGAGPQRSISLRDFYTFEGKKLGELQSTGLTAGYNNILYYLQLRFNQSPVRKLTFLRHALRVPAYIASLLLKEAVVFASIVEDYPYADNKVYSSSESPSSMKFEYTIRDEFRERVLILRKKFLSSLQKHRSMMINDAVTLNYGHPCGTCRAGDSPENSVVDSSCKVHDIDNLYIADGSFMPSSGGTNPSLTIAANALRVSKLLGEKLNGAH